MRFGGAALALAVVLGACGPTEVDTPVRVLAAASLQDALPDLAAAYTAETGASLELAFDASSRLRAQIELGAPGDLFLSADPANADALRAAGIGAGETLAFATSAVVLAAPADDPTVASWDDLAAPGTRIAAAAEGVPISGYADELVRILSASAGAPDRFAARYAANVVSREDSVRGTLARLELGEADAGFVYATDAAIAGDRVRLVRLPLDARVEATYVGLPIDERGIGFLAWLRGSAARRILADHGFGTPP